MRARGAPLGRVSIRRRSFEGNKNMLRLLILAATLLVVSPAQAIVIRHDAQDGAYRIPQSDFPALADMPFWGEGR